MNKQKSKYVEIPRATLSALKNFFVSENGVDVSPIIQDIALGDEDLATINVGLVMNGMSVDLPKTAYGAIYHDHENKVYTFEAYTLEKVSLLRNQVLYSRKEWRIDNGVWKERDLSSSVSSIDAWLDCTNEQPVPDAELHPTPATEGTSETV